MIDRPEDELSQLRGDRGTFSRYSDERHLSSPGSELLWHLALVEDL